MNIDKVTNSTVQNAMNEVPVDQPVNRPENRPVNPSNVERVNLEDLMGGIDGADALQGAQVNALDERIRQIGARHGVWKSVCDFGRKIGRGLMMTAHAIHDLFTSLPVRTKRDNLAALISMKDGQGAGWTCGVAVQRGGNSVTTRLPGRTEPTTLDSDNGSVIDEAVIGYDTDRIGAAMGLRGRIEIKAFSDDEIADIRDCKFSLLDIVQDPGFQDCWFLSSLASFMKAQGAKGVKNLITIPEGLTDSQYGGARIAFVKLADKTYKVPLGDICAGNGSELGVSSSKPWVRLLETAMQMHQMQRYEAAMKENVNDGRGLKVSMGYDNPGIALDALQGTPNGRSRAEMSMAPGENNLAGTVEDIRTALSENRPVVIGSPSNPLYSLKYGISPGHAVSVQGVFGHGDETYLQVFDPYNRSVLVNADILKVGGCTLFIGAGASAQA